MNLTGYLQDARDIHLMAVDAGGHWRGRSYRELETRLTPDNFAIHGLPYNSLVDLLRHESPWLYRLGLESVGATAGRRYLERHGKEHDRYHATVEVLLHPTQFLAFFVGIPYLVYQIIRWEIGERRLHKRLSQKVNGWKAFSEMLYNVE